MFKILKDLIVCLRNMLKINKPKEDEELFRVRSSNNNILNQLYQDIIKESDRVRSSNNNILNQLYQDIIKESYQDIIKESDKEIIKVSSQGLIDIIKLTDKEVIDKIITVINSIDAKKIKAIMNAFEVDKEGWLRVKIDLGLKKE